MDAPTKLLKKGDGLLIVDVQRDFCPGGRLAIEEGDEVVRLLNDWIEAAKGKIPVYASRDWHPKGHPSFQEKGGPWPEHCIQDTEGAFFHASLRLPEDVVVISKGTRFDHDQYSAFSETGFAQRLKEDGVNRIWMGGLALDVCVRATALEGAKQGFDVHVILPATKAVDQAGKGKTLAELRQAGVKLEE